jgi:hypothetical protein
MLSDDQREEFDRSGVLTLREAVHPQAAAEMRERIWSDLAKQGITPESTDAECRVVPSKVRGATRETPFEALWGETTRGAIDAILGSAQWKVPGHAGQLLLTPFPNRGPVGEFVGEDGWVLPSKIWHLDFQAPGWLRSLPGVQLFACLDHVERRAGATLAISGSHLLVDRIRRAEAPEFAGRSADVRRELRQQVPWFRELCSIRQGEDRVARFMEQATDHEGVRLRVVEFSGAPGDVVLMHPWILHAPSANCGTRPRMVLTERIHTCHQPRIDTSSDATRGGAHYGAHDGAGDRTRTCTPFRTVAPKATASTSFATPATRKPA